jgi:dTDP-glucose pyrophosphorylase
MRNYRDHLILSGTPIKDALVQLTILGSDIILFVVDEYDTLLGSITDGDVRRGLIKGISIEEKVDCLVRDTPKYILKGEIDIKKIIDYRENNYKIIPIINSDKKVLNIINFTFNKSFLPIDVVIMAGGRGLRLSPLTDTTPKPLLKIGNKPILEHIIERISIFGIKNIIITINYLGDQIKDYFNTGNSRNLEIKYIEEKKPLGTLGAISKIKHFEHDYILITNSDLLSNINYEDFFLDFIEKNADMSVVTIPYNVNVPYAVLETYNNNVLNFKEKPTYTYYSNAGIYLVKKNILKSIPQNTFYNATDLMEHLIKSSNKIISFPLIGYWLDIGNPDDYAKAENDFKMIKF